MKGFLFIQLLLLSMLAEAQQGWNIVYSHINKEVPAFFPKDSYAWKETYSRLVLNDSMSFWYGMSEKNDPMKNDPLYGSRILHHSSLYDLKKQMIFGGAANASSSKRHYYLTHPPKTEPWILEDSVKMILGYPCKKAFLSTIQWIRHDTSYVPVPQLTVVWYTEKIPLPFGPMQYYGLPGLVLEVSDQRYLGRHIRATGVREDKISIHIPAGKKIKTAEELLKNKD